jgi:hypothetical protein
VFLLSLVFANPASAGFPGAGEGAAPDLTQQEDVATPTSHASDGIRPELPTTRQYVDDQVVRVLEAQGMPLGNASPSAARPKGAGTVRELTQYDTDGNGSIDTHVFWTAVFDPHGNRLLLLEEWDYAPFGALEGRYAETDTYDPHGNLVRHLVELNDPPQGRFNARFLTTTTYDEHAGLPVQIVAESDADADGTIESRDVATFTSDERHHLVRMERVIDGELYSITTWEYDGNGNLSRTRVVTNRTGDLALVESWDYTYDERHRIVRTVYQWGNSLYVEEVLSHTFEFDEHGLVLQSVASHDFDDESGVLERTATKNEYDQQLNLVRTDVLVTDNGHNDEFRSTSTTTLEYDDRDRLVLRVFDRIADETIHHSRIVETFSYTGDDVRAVTERDVQADGTIDSRSILTSTCDSQGQLLHSELDEDRNADGALDFRWLRSFQYLGNRPEPPAGASAESAAPAPVSRGLRAASANPFRGEIALRFSLSERYPAVLRIYDAAGRLVRTLLDGLAASGEQRFVWNGRADSGRPVPTGVYFARLNAAGNQSVVRLLKLR